MTKMNVNWVMAGDNSLVLVVSKNGKCTNHVVAPNENHYQSLVQALEHEDFDKALRLLTPSEVIHTQTKGRVTVNGNGVYYDNTPLHGNLVNKLVELWQSGKPVTRFVKFLENLMGNPSASSVKELYDFIAHKGLVITEDGCFLAYKGVDENYQDVYTHQFNNKVGARHEVQRNQVDDNRQHECSFGFHVGSLEYAGPYGQKTMVVKVNPKDVVSVPLDCSAQKCRVCAYEVVGELETQEHLSYDDLDDFEDVELYDDMDDLDELEDDDSYDDNDIDNDDDDLGWVCNTTTSTNWMHQKRDSKGRFTK